MLRLLVVIALATMQISGTAGEMAGGFTSGDVVVDYTISDDSSEITFQVNLAENAWFALGVSSDGSMTSGGAGSVSVPRHSNTSQMFISSHVVARSSRMPSSARTGSFSATG
jgi:hypothetical protein